MAAVSSRTRSRQTVPQNEGVTPPTPVSQHIIPGLNKEDVERTLNSMATTVLFGIKTRTGTSFGDIEFTYQEASDALLKEGALKAKLQEVLSARFSSLTSNKFANPELLGRGSEGTVFVAECTVAGGTVAGGTVAGGTVAGGTKNKTSYALKILSPIDTQDNNKLLPNEVKANQSLKDRNIRHLAPYVESFVIDQNLIPKGMLSKTQKVHVLVTEFFGKTTVLESLQRSTWNLQKIKKLTKSMLEFFEDVHKEKLLYADTSSGNIIEGNNGEFYVIDLGSTFKLGLKDDANQDHYFYLAKRSYRSPFGLILKSNSKKSKALRKNIDYFSLGIVLLQTILKEDPFNPLERLFDLAENHADPFTIQLIRLHALADITPLSQEFIKMIPLETLSRFFTRKNPQEDYTLRPFPFASGISDLQKEEAFSLLKTFRQDLDQKLEAKCKNFPKKQFDHLKDFIFSHLLAEKKLSSKELKKHPFLNN